MNLMETYWGLIGAFVNLIRTAWTDLISVVLFDSSLRGNINIGTKMILMGT